MNLTLSGLLNLFWEGQWLQPANDNNSFLLWQQQCDFFLDDRSIL